MRIGIAFDLAPAKRPEAGPDDLFEEFDKPETIEALAVVLRGEGFDVELLGDGREFLRKVLDRPVDLVWNLAEGEGVGRCREARVPAVLEMLGIPYTGSDPLTLAASLDKPLAKKLVEGVVAVPKDEIFDPNRADSEARRLAAVLQPNGGPWIVKPAFEGSSKGVRSNALWASPDDAIAQALHLSRDYRQPILIEEFIEGDEVTVGIVGNGQDSEVLGAMHVRPLRPDPRFVYSLEMKRAWSEHLSYETPPRLPVETIDRLHTQALRAYAELGCRDVARIDFRVREGTPYFIEANPLPGLAPDWSDLMILAKGIGLSHRDVVLKILDATLRRVGIRPGASGGTSA